MIDPFNHERVFLTTNDGGLIVTETAAEAGRTAEPEASLALPPRGGIRSATAPARLCELLRRRRPLKSEDQGKTWERRLFGSSTTYTTGIAVDPVDHSVYVATVGGGFALLPNGVWKSTDFGETFTRIDRAPGAAPDEFLDMNGRGITVDPHNHTTVYLPDRSSGLWRSQDAGASWVNVHETPAFSVTVDPVDPQIAYAGTVFQGVLKSVDGGSTWAQKSNGLPSFDPSDPDAYFAISRTAGVRSTPGTTTCCTPARRARVCSRARTAPKPGGRSTWDSTIRVSSVWRSIRSTRTFFTRPRARRSSRPGPVVSETRFLHQSGDRPSGGSPAFAPGYRLTGVKSEIRAGFRDGSVGAVVRDGGGLGPGSVTDRQCLRHRRDTQGSSLAGAAVGLTGPGAAQRATTDGTGDFRFLGLSPGDYSVALELTGFETVRADVTVALANVVLSFVMPVAGIEEAVEVTGDSAPPGQSPDRDGRDVWPKGAGRHSHDTGSVGRSPADPERWSTP